MEAHAGSHGPLHQQQPTADAAEDVLAQHMIAALHLEESQQQPGSSDQQPPTPFSLFSLLPHHIIPRITSPECVRALLETCKAAHSLSSSSSTHVQANWLEQQCPATALYAAMGTRRRTGSQMTLTLLREIRKYADISSANWNQLHYQVR